MTCGAPPPFDMDTVRVHEPTCILGERHAVPHHFRSLEHDHPFHQTARDAEAIITKYPKTRVYQKWTCQHCGARETMTEVNKFFTTGECEECGLVTDIVANGCNYLLVKSLATATDIADLLGEI